MALTVVSRPAKEIEGNTSTWNAVNLPIQYKFDSDLFPVNSVDPSPSVLTFTNNGGFLEVELSASITNVLDNETIQLSGCNVDSFNGIWKVKEKISNSEYVLLVPYDANLTVANFQKYYSNYFVEVNLYSGLPTWHTKQADKPISNIGTLRLIPNVDNEIVASFSGVIKSDIEFNNQLSEGIELDSFTGFYVEWREGYDQNINGDIETFYENWEIDQVVGCGSNVITNGDFPTDLSDWSQVDLVTVGEPFIWSGGAASSNLNTIKKTKVLYQEVNTIPNVSYDISVDITRSSGVFSIFWFYGSNDLVTFDSLLRHDGTTSGTHVATFSSANSYKYIGVHFFREAPANTTVTVDNISLTPTVCEYQFWGSNSSLQFQNIRGGNMYDYVGRDINSKFMTNFNIPTLFEGEYFDTSMILDNSTLSDIDISDVAYMWVVASDIGQADGTSITSITDRTGNVNLTIPVGQEPTYKTSGVNGYPSIDFDGVNDRINTDINVSQPVCVYVAFNYRNTGSLYDADNPDRTTAYINGTLKNIDMFSGTILRSTTVTTPNTDYVFKGHHDGVNSSLTLDNVVEIIGTTGNNIGLVNTYFGETAGGIFYDGAISEIIIVPCDLDPCTQWQLDSYLGQKYGTYVSQNYGYTQKEYDNLGNLLGSYSNDINFEDTGVYRIEPTINNTGVDKIELQLISGNTCTLSENKTIKVNSECNNQEIYLTWLNELGGWDYWKFTAEKDYSLNISNKETIQRNIFNDWDNTFINGDTQNDVISANANRSIGVFSQYLNTDEIEAISTIKYSTKVQLIDGTKKTTIIVDSDTLTLFNDGDEEDLHTIRFNIQLPNIQSQSQ